MARSSPRAGGGHAAAGEDSDAGSARHVRNRMHRFCDGDQRISRWSTSASPEFPDPPSRPTTGPSGGERAFRARFPDLWTNLPFVAWTRTSRVRSTGDCVSTYQASCRAVPRTRGVARFFLPSTVGRLSLATSGLTPVLPLERSTGSLTVVETAIAALETANVAATPGAIIATRAPFPLRAQSPEKPARHSSVPVWIPQESSRRTVDETTCRAGPAEAVGGPRSETREVVVVRTVRTHSLSTRFAASTSGSPGTSRRA